MTTKQLNGKQRAEQVIKRLTYATQQLAAQYNIVPKLVVITVGDDSASQVYVRQKQLKAEKIGYHFDWITLPQDTTQTQLLEIIERLNKEDAVNGIIVQLPLPQHLDEKDIIEAIDFNKDVDGFHPLNVGRLVGKQESLMPCTPKGILDLLQAYNIPLKGQHVVILGRSLIVGMPLQILLTQHDATVTICHSHTKDVAYFTRQADIVISAVGKPHFVKPEMLASGAVVVDVGINRLENGKIVGDVAYDAVKDQVSWITPVPGGVGPMTVAMLMQQTFMATCQQHQIDSSLFFDE